MGAALLGGFFFFYFVAVSVVGGCWALRVRRRDGGSRPRFGEGKALGIDAGNEW